MYEKTVGTRLEVFRGKAEKTSYGKNALFKKDLIKNKRGRIVSKKASRSAKEQSFGESGIHNKERNLSVLLK